jgi:hypothetical protein
MSSRKATTATAMVSTTVKAISFTYVIESPVHDRDVIDECSIRDDETERY